MKKINIRYKTLWPNCLLNCPYLPSAQRDSLMDFLNAEKSWLRHCIHILHFFILSSFSKMSEHIERTFLKLFFEPMNIENLKNLRIKDDISVYMNAFTPIFIEIIPSVTESPHFLDASDK